MSDSNLAGPVVTDPEQHVPRARRGGAAAQRCRFCAHENAGHVVDAGGDIGRVHRACFIEWDGRQEALEMAAMVTLSLPGRRVLVRARDCRRGPAGSGGVAPRPTPRRPLRRGGAVPSTTGGRP
jgi:hypothetical protein